MPNPIEVHAVADVAGEAVGLPGQRDRSPAGLPGRHPGLGAGVGQFERTAGSKAGSQAPARGGDTPVAPDAGYRAGGEPESPADHGRASFLVSAAWLPASSAWPLAPITRPGSARRGVRRRLTAWRTP